MVKKTWCMIKMNIIFADCVHIYIDYCLWNCSLMCPHLIFGNYIVHSPRNENFNLLVRFNFYTPVLRRSALCNWVWRVGRHPHRLPHNNFSSVYQIFTNLGHMIPLWKGKNPIYFGVIRSKVKVTVTINIIFDNRIVSAR